MVKKYTVRKKSKYPLVILETAGIAIFLAYYFCKKYQWDWVTGLVIFIITLFLVSILFFGSKVFRYIFSIVFSLFWGFLAYAFADSATKSSYSPWLALALGFFISLILHWVYFKDERDSDKITIR